MKFFTTAQIRLLDQFTIEHEPILSIDLMERAANALFRYMLRHFTKTEPVYIFAGHGNNGGDALALARMLLHSGFHVSVTLIHSGTLSADCELNRNRLHLEFPSSLTELYSDFTAPEVTHETILVDGLFGSGLSRPISSASAKAVQWMNQSGCRIISIDIPSGFSGEENKPSENSVIVRATTTLSFQFPKLCFLLAENNPYVGRFDVLDIGIHPEAIKNTPSNLFFLEVNDIKPLLKKRTKFSHKGTYGHVLIVSGSKGMSGASVLSSKAALRTGAGLVTVHGPACNRIIVQTAIPEVIFNSDPSESTISHIESIEPYNVIAVGPGIGTTIATVDMLRDLLIRSDNPCVIDADALNIISIQKDLLQHIPENSIITPHPKEFERLFGPCFSSYERIMKAQQASKAYGIIIILKGAHTLISLPSGNLYFNSTGNSGMATAGSGDVLTGILVSLLAQGYLPEDAALTGVFLHGRAGDLALVHETKESLIAGDIISSLGAAFRSIQA